MPNHGYTHVYSLEGHFVGVAAVATLVPTTKVETVLVCTPVKGQQQKVGWNFYGAVLRTFCKQNSGVLPPKNIGSATAFVTFIFPPFVKQGKFLRHVPVY